MKDEHGNIIRELGFSLLDEGKTLRIRAEGYSMYPAIKAGTIVYVEPVEDPHPGEIIAWKRESGFVVHRLVRIIDSDGQSLYITRGDSCANEDIPVKRAQIAGRVVSAETQQGMKKSLDSKPVRRFSYIYNRFLVWIILIFKRILKGIKLLSG